MCQPTPHPPENVEEGEGAVSPSPEEDRAEDGDADADDGLREHRERQADLEVARSLAPVRPEAPGGRGELGEGGRVIGTGVRRLARLLRQVRAVERLRLRAGQVEQDSGRWCWLCGAVALVASSIALVVFGSRG